MGRMLGRRVWRFKGKVSFRVCFPRIRKVSKKILTVRVWFLCMMLIRDATKDVLKGKRASAYDLRVHPSAHTLRV